MINSWPLMIYTADDQRRINYCTNRAAASPAPVPDGAAGGTARGPQNQDSPGHRCPRPCLARLGAACPHSSQPIPPISLPSTPGIPGCTPGPVGITGDVQLTSTQPNHPSPLAVINPGKAPLRLTPFLSFVIESLSVVTNPRRN